MAFIIIAVIMIIYLILIAWTWQSLGFIEKPKKIAFIALGILIMFIITLMVFYVAKGRITYENIEMQKSVQNMLVAVFTGVNGILVMPQVAKLFDKINENQIEKSKLKASIMLLILIFVLCLIIEAGYMKDTQEGILRMYHAKIGG